MPKIALGVTGACRVTASSAKASPSDGVRSPEASRSRTVVPSAKATTSSPRTSPARGPSSPSSRNVASLIGRAAYAAGLGGAARVRPATPAAGPGGPLLDEAGQLHGPLALGVMAHAGPDLDVRLGQRRL